MFSLREYEAVEVAVRIDGEVLHSLCLLGEDGMDPLLGAVTLELFSLGVDPVNRRLIPVVGLAKTM